VIYYLHNYPRCVIHYLHNCPRCVVYLRHICPQCSISYKIFVFGGEYIRRLKLAAAVSHKSLPPLSFPYGVLSRGTYRNTQQFISLLFSSAWERFYFASNSVLLRFPSLAGRHGTVYVPESGEQTGGNFVERNKPRVITIVTSAPGGYQHVVWWNTSGRCSSELCHCDVWRHTWLRLISIRLAGHIAWTGAIRNTYRILMGKLDAIRPLWIYRRNVGNNIKIALRHSLEFDLVYWTYLAQDRDKWQAVVNTMMNLRIPSNPGNFLISWAAVGFSMKSVQIQAVFAARREIRPIGLIPCITVLHGSLPDLQRFVRLIRPAVCVLSWILPSTLYVSHTEHALTGIAKQQTHTCTCVFIAWWCRSVPKHVGFISELLPHAIKVPVHVLVCCFAILLSALTGWF
jgi:hypothetical protein